MGLQSACLDGLLPGDGIMTEHETRMEEQHLRPVLSEENERESNQAGVPTGWGLKSQGSV